MNVRGGATRVLLFVVIVAGITGASALTAPSPEPAEPITAFEPVEYDVFQPAGIPVVEDAPKGRVELTANETRKTVVIDLEHRNGISDTDIEPLVSELVAEGHRVRYFDEDTAEPGGLENVLKDADAFVVITPSDRFEEHEVKTVQRFARRGGRVLLVAEPADTRRTIFGFRQGGIAHGHADVAARFGISFGSGYLYNMRENDNNFQSIYAETWASGELREGINRVVLRGAAPVRSHDGNVILVASPGTRLSTTRDPRQYPVVVRKQNVIAVGDASFLFPENADVADNEVLISNLGDFLVSGDRTTNEERSQATNNQTTNGTGA